VGRWSLVFLNRRGGRDRFCEARVVQCVQRYVGLLGCAKVFREGKIVAAGCSGTGLRGLKAMDCYRLVSSWHSHAAAVFHAWHRVVRCRSVGSGHEHAANVAGQGERLDARQQQQQNRPCDLTAHSRYCIVSGCIESISFGGTPGG
jgi:hypothetical protein